MSASVGAGVDVVKYCEELCSSVLSYVFFIISIPCSYNQSNLAGAGAIVVVRGVDELFID